MHESEKQTRVQLILHRFLEGVRVTALPDCNFSFHGHTKGHRWRTIKCWVVYLGMQVLLRVMHFSIAILQRCFGVLEENPICYTIES
jgi:hypothetical protein